jgi:hypothetical protein
MPHNSPVAGSLVVKSGVMTIATRSVPRRRSAAAALSGERSRKMVKFSTWRI